GLAVDEPGQRATDGFRPEVLELPQGRRVERAGLATHRAELPEPAAHLPGGPAGEGDGEHAGRLEAAGPYPVGDPVGDRPRLAGTGAGQHAHRAVQRGGHLALLGVEPFEHRVGRVRYLREEGGVRCCCHTAMLPGRRRRVSRLSTGGPSQSYERRTLTGRAVRRRHARVRRRSLPAAGEAPARREWRRGGVRSLDEDFPEPPKESETTCRAL